eukprot:TRINITY_DN20802_c0_g1_i1.p1 TRINITY_DN20802_c0_g1~~TRINITY_DN20802_c0_g1_i1.p1  ORF type:complete len:532 (+),score=67.18 TRINITY_DN20802_c0_g1_i1:85-1596(+)
MAAAAPDAAVAKGPAAAAGAAATPEGRPTQQRPRHHLSNAHSPPGHHIGSPLVAFWTPSTMAHSPPVDPANPELSIPWDPHAEAAAVPPLLTRYPAKVLRVPGTALPLPPQQMRVPVPASAQPEGRRASRRGREKEKAKQRQRSGERRVPYPAALLPGPGGSHGWRPPGCGCWLDPNGLLARIPRDAGPPTTPACTLTPCQIHELMGALPRTVQWLPWYVVHSTDEHGFSCRELRRRTAGLRDLLLVLGTAEGDTLGAFMSRAPPQQTQNFDGCGETFVWTFRQGRLHVYRWSRKNDFFIRSFADGSFGLGGGGDGAAQALFVGADLQYGSTAPCATYDSPSLLGARPDAEARFELARVELWAFGPLDGGAGTEPPLVAPCTPVPDAAPAYPDSEGDDLSPNAADFGTPAPQLPPPPPPGVGGMLSPVSGRSLGRAASPGGAHTPGTTIGTRTPGASPQAAGRVSSGLADVVSPARQRRRRGPPACQWHLSDPGHHLCCLRTW